MSNTPRTDAEASHVSVGRMGEILIWPSIGGAYVTADFARQLERELNEARQTIEDVCTGGKLWCDKCQQNLPCLCGNEGTK